MEFTPVACDCLFVLVLTEEEKEEAGKNNYNFDHPDAFDTELITKTLEKLKAGKRVEIPIYNFKVNRNSFSA
jgi:uridine kinase